MAGRLTEWGPHAALALATATAAATGLAITRSVPVWTAAAALVSAVLAAAAGRRLPRTRPALVVLGAGAALTAAVGTLVLPDRWATGLLVVALAVALPWLLGRSSRQQADLAAAAAERARLRERSLIAREMHDTLGHDLALLALRAGALQLAADLPEHHRDAATELRAGAGRATGRLAAVVAVLRDGDPAPLEPPTERIDELVSRAERAGITAHLDRSGPHDLPADVDRAAYRVVREGLTNAVKHAPGAAVTIRLATAGPATVVEVTNPLTDPGAGRTRGGTGLAGLAERLRPLGGSVSGAVRGRTYRLRATLPHRAGDPG